MASLTDERVRFYLRHREQIETWAALAKDASTAIDELLEQLAPEVQELGASLAPDLVVTPLIEGEGWPKLLLHREAWGQDPKSPRVSVGLEWVRGKTFLTGGTSPYVGVRVAVHDEAGKALRDRLRDRLLAARTTRRDKASAWWPAYRYVAAEGAFWNDFDAYRGG